MARTWHELFETGADAPESATAGTAEPERRGFFKRLRDNMAKTRQAIGAELQTTIFQSLDDVNLQRFLQLVGGFAADSQVLIVTHQKRTMEIAGMLYGISLNNDGTTKVVAQRLDQRRDVRAIDVAEAARVIEVPQSEPVG